jgi:pimeloyl-ACP methyl ester carboxylesterase
MRKSRKATKTLISYGLLAVLIAACSSSEVNTAAPVDDVSSFEKAIEWSACEGEDAPMSPFECGFVTVPLDYRDATGKTIEIAVIRLPASEGEAKGIILTNPGGPGGSGFDDIANTGQELVADLGIQKFDLVGFDTRGVDRSNGLKCISDKERDQALYVDYTPDNANEKAIYEKVDAWDAACEKKFGKAMLNYSTEFIARDMDLIRAGMGFKKLNYLGVSYGTYLGAVYATLFPDHVEAMVLDSAFDPQGDTPEQEKITQAEGFEKAFKNWMTWCEIDANECEFKSTDIRAAWVALNDKLDKKSLIATDGREVNANVMEEATSVALYSDSWWSSLASALHQAELGRGDELQEMADLSNYRKEDGTYLSSTDSFPIIGCASGFFSQVVDDSKNLVKKLKEVSPTFYRNAEAQDYEDKSCDDVFVDQKILTVKFAGSAPIIVIGGKNDPATPLRWSEEMTANMGDSAVLVTYTGEGHGHVAASRCVAKIAGLVFTKKQAPKEGTVCKPDVPVAEPSWWDTAIRNIGGTNVDTELGNYYFSIDSVDAFARYRAIPGSQTSVFASVSRQLTKNGFAFEGSTSEDPSMAPQWFQSATDENALVGVWVETPDSLAKNSMYEPDGELPKGTILVALYYWPPSK